MYISGTNDHKVFCAFMQARKAFHFTGTKEAQADLVQYYVELAEEKKKKQKRRE